jgi:hypothetical protein
MPTVDDDMKSLQSTYAVLLSVLMAALAVAVFIAVDASDSTSAHTQVITGTFMGLSIDGGSLALQPEGTNSGTSYAFSKDTMWISSTGVVHMSEPATCLETSNKGHKITIGVVWTKPQGYAPGISLLAYVRC